MEKSQAISGNGKSSDSCLMPLHNALGLKYWPQYVQDDHKRYFPRQSNFISDEDMMIAGLDGSPLTNPWDLLGFKDISDRRGEAICAAPNYEPESGDQAANESLDDDDYRLDGVDFRDQVNAVHGLIFTDRDLDEDVMEEGDLRVSFHGITRQSVVARAKEKLFHRPRQKMNAKRRFCRYVRRDKTIRTAYLDKLASKAEMIALIAEAEMAARFNQRVAKIIRTI